MYQFNPDLATSFPSAIAIEVTDGSSQPVAAADNNTQQPQSQSQQSGAFLAPSTSGQQNVGSSLPNNSFGVPQTSGTFGITVNSGSYEGAPHPGLQSSDSQPAFGPAISGLTTTSGLPPRGGGGNNFLSPNAGNQAAGASGMLQVPGGAGGAGPLSRVGSRFNQFGRALSAREDMQSALASHFSSMRGPPGGGMTREASHLIPLDAASRNSAEEQQQQQGEQSKMDAARPVKLEPTVANRHRSASVVGGLVSSPSMSLGRGEFQFGDEDEADGGGDEGGAHADDDSNSPDSSELLKKTTGSSVHGHGGGGSGHGGFGALVEQDRFAQMQRRERTYRVLIDGDDGGFFMKQVHWRINESRLRDRYRAATTLQSQGSIRWSKSSKLNFSKATGLMHFASADVDLSQIPSWSQFAADIENVLLTVENAACSKAAEQRLSIIAERSKLLMLLNRELEAQQTPDMDGGVFAEVTKVDNSLRLLRCWSAQDGLECIVDSLSDRAASDVVGQDGSGTNLTLGEVFARYDCENPAGLTPDRLGWHGRRVVRQSRIGSTEPIYNSMLPVAKPLTTLLQQLDSKLLQKVLRRRVRGIELSAVSAGDDRPDDDRFGASSGTAGASGGGDKDGGGDGGGAASTPFFQQAAEIRIPFYGVLSDELSRISRAFKVNEFGGNRRISWFLELNLFDYPSCLPAAHTGTAHIDPPAAAQSAVGRKDNFLNFLEALFLPLVNATLLPEERSNSGVAWFLEQVGGFVFCSREGRARPAVHANFVHPAQVKLSREESSKFNDAYYEYFIWANLHILNSIRSRRGMNTFQYRRNTAGGDVTSLISGYLLADVIANCGSVIHRYPVLQYLLGMAVVPITVSPIFDNAHGLPFKSHPLPALLHRCLKLALATEEPLHHHHQPCPINEEYAIAQKTFRLSALDLTQMMRNSVLMSSFSNSTKRAWLGDGWQEGPGATSQVSVFRFEFRNDVWNHEREILADLASQRSTAAAAATAGGAGGNNTAYGVGVFSSQPGAPSSPGGAVAGAAAGGGTGGAAGASSTAPDGKPSFETAAGAGAGAAGTGKGDAGSGAAGGGAGEHGAEPASPVVTGREGPNSPISPTALARRGSSAAGGVLGGGSSATAAAAANNAAGSAQQQHGKSGVGDHHHEHHHHVLTQGEFAAAEQRLSRVTDMEYFAVTDKRVNFPRTVVAGPGTAGVSQQSEMRSLRCAEYLLRALQMRQHYVWKPPLPWERRHISAEEAFRKKTSSFDESEWQFKQKEAVFLSFRRGEVHTWPRGLPTLESFCRDYYELKRLTDDEDLRKFAFDRLDVLEHKFRLHLATNHAIESGVSERGGVGNRDFYHCTKVDTHIHCAAAMTARQMRDFILHKLEHNPDDVVDKDKDGRVLTFSEFAERYHITKNLTVDQLNVLADHTLFQRFDNFNNHYNPMAEAQIRGALLKTGGNFCQGKYFAELIRGHVFTAYSKDRYTFAENRLSVYGISKGEWADLAQWFDTFGMSSKHNKWMIQLPRLFAFARGTNKVTSFGQYIENIFEPLWEVSLHPSKYPRIHTFLNHVSGFDSVDNEAKIDPAFVATSPWQWTEEVNPPYPYYMYHLWANLRTLNEFRSMRGLSTLTFRPHCLAKPDMEILSDTGFIGYEEARRRWDCGQLRVAGFDARSSQIVYEAPTAFVDKDGAPEDGLYEIHTDRAAYGTVFEGYTKKRDSNSGQEKHISMRVTGQHHLLVKESTEFDRPNRGTVRYTKVTVDDLYHRGTWRNKLNPTAFGPNDDIRLVSTAASGIAGGTGLAEQLVGGVGKLEELCPRVAELRRERQQQQQPRNRRRARGAGDHEEEQQQVDHEAEIAQCECNFSWLIGFFVGDGSLRCNDKGGARDPNKRYPSVILSQKKVSDVNIIVKHLKSLGLKQGTLTAGGDFSTTFLPSDGRTEIAIWKSSWVDFFFSEYGYKYQSFVDCADDAFAGCAGMKRRALAAVERRFSDVVRRADYTDEAAWLAAIFGIIRVKSFKWIMGFFFKVRKQLAEYCLAGLSEADGKSTGGLGYPSGAANKVWTSSPHLRDEVERLALHCGYTVFHAMEYDEGADRGTPRGQAAAAVARNICWSVNYSPPTYAAAPNIRRSQIRKVENYKDGVWCVTVPSGHIVVRRRCTGLNRSYRPTIIGNCGESGATEHLIACFLCSDAINHGINLKNNTALQYIYYLAQIGMDVSPLSNNALFLYFLDNPFPKFFRCGLNVALSTDDPLMFHQTTEPLIEEYSIAAKVWGLSPNDMCEIARNSCLHSGFSHEWKAKHLGNRFHLSSSLSNDPHLTHLSDVRVAYRFETYHAEISYLEKFLQLAAAQRGEDSTAAAIKIPRFMFTSEVENTVIEGETVATEKVLFSTLDQEMELLQRDSEHKRDTLRSTKVHLDTLRNKNRALIETLTDYVTKNDAEDKRQQTELDRLAVLRERQRKLDFLRSAGGGASAASPAPSSLSRPGGGAAGSMRMLPVTAATLQGGDGSGLGGGGGENNDDNGIDMMDALSFGDGDSQAGDDGGFSGRRVAPRMPPQPRRPMHTLRVGRPVPEPSPQLVQRSRQNNAGHHVGEDLLTELMLSHGEIPRGGVDTPPPGTAPRADDDEDDDDADDADPLLGGGDRGNKKKKGPKKKKKTLQSGDVLELGKDPVQLARDIDDSLEMLKYLARGQGTTPKLDVSPSLFELGDE